MTKDRDDATRDVPQTSPLTLTPETAAPESVDQPLSSQLDTLIRGRRRWLASRRAKLAALAGVLTFVWWFVPPVWRLVDGPVTVTRWDRKAGETQATVGPGQKGWISNKKISRHALHAIIAAEDGKFYEHNGFDFGEIASSIETNLKRKRFARGGSTLSQQVVKMAFLGREKTLTRKAREAVGTVLMELILGKEKILEWYINLAEFGDGVYGIEEGCRHYFKTKPELLSIEQSVHLALVLPSPNAWSRGLRARHLTPFGHRRFAVILNRMRQSGYITRTQWAAAVTRGDFGRPIVGYAGLLAQEEKKTLCPGNPGCPEGDEDVFDEDQPEMSFPSPSPSPSTGMTTEGTTASGTPPVATPDGNALPEAGTGTEAASGTVPETPTEAPIETPIETKPATQTEAPPP